MELRGKTALVTGGAVRIGRAICEALAAAGVNVVIHYWHSRSAAEVLRARLQKGGVRAWLVKAELRSEDACVGLISDAVAAAGRFEILINNAAVFHKDSLRFTTAEKLLAEFWPNLFAPLLLTRAFVERCGSGRIVNLLDRRIASRDTSCVPYLLSKQALAALTELAALELAPLFTVNGVAPGAILPPPGRGAAYLRDAAGPVPLQQPCTPADVATAVVGLLQQEAVTGQIVYVDGGQHLL